MSRLPGVTTAWLMMILSLAGSAVAQRPTRPTRPSGPRPGGTVKIMPSEADPNALAAAAAPAIAKAAADFTAQWKALTTAESGTGVPAYATPEVGKLLGSAQEAAQKALGEPELAPLKDRTALIFRRARAALGGSGGGGQIDKAAADRALEPIGQYLDRLAALAAQGPVTVDLCVISKPEPGARFSLRPASNPSAVKILPATDGPITAVRGLYAYRLEPGPGAKGKPIECGWASSATPPAAGEGCLDLFDDGKTPLVCDFAQGTCQRAAGTCS
jgi:hypothetical protein